jgi:hypothetical protein
MRLPIERRESEGIAILDLKGPLTWGHGDWAVDSFFPDRALKRFGVLNFVRSEDDRNSNRGAPGSGAAC